MRWIGWMVALLLTLGWIAVEVDVAEPARPRLAASDWRRTRVGWEQPTWLDAHIPARAPTLHPAVVGLLELFLSLFGLVAFAARRCHNGPHPKGRHNVCTVDGLARMSP